MARLERAPASAGFSFVSQRAAVMRRPVKCSGLVRNEPRRRRTHDLGTEHLVARPAGFVGDQRRIGRAARHQHIDGDAAAVELLGPHRRHRFERRFGRAIGQHAQHRDVARGVVDDAAEAAALHIGQRRAHQHHRRAHEDRHEAVPDLRRQFLDAGSARFGVGPDARHADAGIVDDGFDGAELGAGGGNGALAARFSAEIGGNGMQAITGGTVLGGKSTPARLGRNRPRQPNALRREVRPLSRGRFRQRRQLTALLGRTAKPSH